MKPFWRLLITLAISKCYEKVRVLFFRATTLVSACKSHSSGVRGLLMRCLLFNPFSFLIFCNNGWLKIAKGPPFTVCGIVRFFKMNIFCLEFRFSQAQHAISEFCFFLKKKTGVFSMRLFLLICSHRSPCHFLLETKRFASTTESLGFSALCDLPSFKKFRKKN